MAVEQTSTRGSGRQGVRRRPLRLAFAGGGTGGHIVPGLHLLDHVEAGELGDLLWFHSGRRVEERVMAGLEERLAPVPFEKLALAIEPDGGGAPSFPRIAMRLSPEVRRARAVLRAHRSDVLLGLGGFTAAPAVLAARSLGVPACLLEINAVPGKATRYLARFCKKVFHAWPATVPRERSARREGRHVHCGPPLAPGFSPSFGGSQESRRLKREFGFDDARPLLLVLGGSQGAKALNAFVRGHAATLLGAGVQVLHQVGPGRSFEGAGELTGYRALEYVHDVPAALVAADLVLCRGGASTLAEIAAVGTPAWVVPYPHHKDRHQRANAEQLGAGVRIVDESELGLRTRDELVHAAGPRGEAERRAMRDALLEAVPTDAAPRIWKALVGLAG